MNTCDGILQYLKDEYQFSSSDSIRSFVSQTLSGDYENFRRLREQSKISGGIEAYDIFGLSGSGEAEKVQFEALKSKFKNEGAAFFSNDHMSLMVARISNKSIADAWLNCVKDQTGVFAFYTGDALDRFTVVLKYKPHDDNDPDLTITGFSANYSSIPQDSNHNFEEGAKLKRNSSIAQQFQRNNPKKIRIHYSHIQRIL